MKNQKELMAALLEGKTLRNTVTGSIIIKLDEKGNLNTEVAWHLGTPQDFEILEPKKLLSRQDFKEAWDANYSGNLSEDVLFDRIMKDLGL